MTSKFSVLCSLYHQEKPSYLELCFQSLQWQKLEATEIVVVHDGPLTEGLYRVLDKWSAKLPIKEVVLPNNVGLGEALNAGLAQCSFELIARVDTDDINHVDRFEKQINYLVQNPGVAAISCDVNEFESDPAKPERIRTVPKQDILAYSLRRNPINHMAAVFRKGAILDVGSYKHLHFMEDYYLWLRLQAQGYKIDNIDDVLVSARVGNGMLERRSGLKYALSEIKIMTKIYALKLDKSPSSFIYYFLRALLRIAPNKVLSKVYELTRKKI
ncbi:glycosyltransferase [Vibrio sp. CJQ_6]|uniref:glycosyltransferase n=1 Tax=Vibrio sp. CJQ_6 TaxID=3367165 RepID=UPI00370C3DE9